MKNLLFAALLLSLVTPIFAQQSDDGSSSQLSKLRQNYVDDLNSLLQQYVKDNNLAGAKAVTQEIDKVASQAANPASTPAAVPEDTASPCGTWVWSGGVLLVGINPDGTISRDGKAGTNVWHWIDKGNRKLRIDWTSGWVDHLTLSEDGETMDVVNNDGDAFTVHRLPKDNGDATPTPTP